MGDGAELKALSRAAKVEIVPYKWSGEGTAEAPYELATAEDLLARLVKIVHALPMETEQQETFLKDVEQAAEKSVNKMLFGLRDTVCPETFEECIEGLEKTYEG